MADNPLGAGLRLPDDVPLVRKLGHELIEFLPVGVYLCNAAGNLTTYNPKAAEIWGEAPDLSKEPVKYTGAYRQRSENGAHIPLEQSPLAAVLLSKKPITNLRLIIERRDGSQVPVLANIIPLLGKDGAMMGFMSSVQDLRELAAQERAQNNLQNALFQAQKMEQVAKVEGGVVHDFTNQLTSLSMSLSLMEREIMDSGSEQLQARLTLCKEATDRVTQLAEDLLLFARSRPRALERIDPNQLLLGMSRLIGNETGQPITVALDLATDANFLKANRQQLESAIINLVINAREAMPNGGKLTLSTFNTLLDRSNFPHHNANFKPGRYVVIRVTDDGNGIAPDALEHIFTPFYTTKAVDKNTGLGLTMIKSLITDINGQLAVTSRLGEGTSVSLYFPCYGSEHSLAITGSEQPHER
ncbi:two-component system sensor histidine kinase NtrB [Phytopseudomonas punonensis]|uniref:histidine kinase n=1 Tax=Phytopseudomonas punonensis TaxID=1220495 RepID=A0A1M6YTU1_9GAMM|nr:ATP-binding protein [Pseudomonas punonensis]SHL21459.1 PAS domain-containing protein [Pseudomonas punonensis]